MAAREIDLFSIDSVDNRHVCVLQPMYLTDFGTKGADLKGIYYLRNVVDADALVAAIAEAKKKSNKVVHGLLSSHNFPAVARQWPLTIRACVAASLAWPLVLVIYG